MYLALVLLGFLHGLVLLPVSLINDAQLFHFHLFGRAMKQAKKELNKLFSGGVEHVWSTIQMCAD